VKSIHFFIFTLLATFIFAQDLVEKQFTKSSNKYYIGSSVSPTFVALLNGQRLEPEWKIANKQRLSVKNYYFRLSYSFLGQGINNSYTYEFLNYNFIQKVTYTSNDSMDWVSRNSSRDNGAKR